MLDELWLPGADDVDPAHEWLIVLDHEERLSYTRLAPDGLRLQELERIGLPCAPPSL